MMKHHTSTRTCVHLARSPAASTRLGGGVASPDLRPPLAPDQRTPGSLYTLQATLRPAPPPPPPRLARMWWWQASSSDEGPCQLWCRDWAVSVGRMREADLVRTEDSGGRALALAACWLLVIVLLSLTVCPNTRTPADFCISELPMYFICSIHSIFMKPKNTNKYPGPIQRRICFYPADRAVYLVHSPQSAVRQYQMLRDVCIYLH